MRATGAAKKLPGASGGEAAGGEGRPGAGPAWRLAAAGTLGLGRVPGRVRAAVDRERAELELVVTLVQIAAILTFAALYALTPKAFPPDVPFEPVPIALGAYAAFTLVRLRLALGRRLTFAFLAASTVVDVALLMLTIWSFHLQYQAPPAISLKAPTLMYVFIMIALRTLSFDPRLVLLAGGTAVTLWLGLVGYAVLWQPMPVTRDFLVYTTSTAILLGAEFDKAVSIGVVTLILALMLTRARALLVRAATEREAAAELSRFFAPEVAERIRGTERLLEAGFGERREATILMADLRGFTAATARLGPEGVVALLSEYQDRAIAAVHAHGGSIDKFLGDGVLASFGATLPTPDHAARGLRALEALLEAGEGWREGRAARGLPAPRVNAALATGAVVFGTVGNAMRLEYTVIGDPVNLAAKLEKHCKVEGARAVAAAPALRLAALQGATPREVWRDRPGARVEGVAEALDLAVLLPEGEGAP